MSAVNTEKEQTPLDVLKAETRKFLSRDEWLSAAGKLKEEEHEVEGFGLLLLSELTGSARAEIVGQQSEGFLADKKKIDAKAYQHQLLLNGVMDPTSPKGDRKPLFKMGDIEQVMKVGGSKIAEIVDVIERLSSLGQYGTTEEVTKNSGSTQNGASTS